MLCEEKVEEMTEERANRYSVTVITDFGGEYRYGSCDDVGTRNSSELTACCRRIFFTAEVRVPTTNSSERTSDPTVSFSVVGLNVVDSLSVLIEETFAASDGVESLRTPNVTV
jgi:hypothetical protein